MHAIPLQRNLHEPKLAATDARQGVYNAPQFPIQHDNDDMEEDEFHVERIIDKEIVRGKPQYLLKWRNEGPEHNVWYLIEDSEDYMDLIRKVEANPLRASRWYKSLRPIPAPDPVPCPQ